MFDEVLGLRIQDAGCRMQEAGFRKQETNLSEEIRELLDSREKARKENNWEESDRLRDVIREKGFEVKDTESGQVVERI